MKNGLLQVLTMFEGAFVINAHKSDDNLVKTQKLDRKKQAYLTKFAKKVKIAGIKPDYPKMAAHKTSSRLSVNLGGLKTKAREDRRKETWAKQKTKL